MCGQIQRLLYQIHRHQGIIILIINRGENLSKFVKILWGQKFFKNLWGDKSLWGELKLCRGSNIYY